MSPDEIIDKHYGFSSPEFNSPETIEIKPNDNKTINSLSKEGLIVEFGQKCKGNNLITLEKIRSSFGKFKINFNGDNNEVFIAKPANDNILIQGQTVFNGNNNKAIICKGMIQQSKISIRFWGSNQTFFWGKGSTSNGANFVLQGDNKMILVGEDCQFAKDIWVRNSDMHSVIDLTTKKQINKVNNIIIEPHVWIGQEAMLLTCEKIGFGSIIGAKSLVKKDILPLSSYAGIPAKLIKENISWDRSAIFRKETLDYIELLKSHYPEVL